MQRFRIAAAITAAVFTLLAAPAAPPEDWRAPAGRDFPLPGGNLGNQRYSTLTQVTPANVSRLGGAWMVHVTDGVPVGPMEATPVVVDGVMYLPAGGDVMALNAATGAELWRYHSPVRGGTNRGVVVAEGKVFSSAGHNTLVALDQRTGALLWTATVGERGTTVAPAFYYGGLVYMGVSGGEAGVRGFFGAYDAKTGKQAWGFWTIPGPGERGHETWEGDSWQHGGGPVWTHPAIDPELGMVYIAIGNAGPDEDGTRRAGDNLFTVSIVALDLKTGAYKWHFQEVHHDLWDYDNSASPVLADISYRGRPRKLLLHAGKTGMVYILDRTDGRPLLGMEERPVPQEPRNHTAPTQPFPVGDSFVPTCPEPGSVAAGAKSSCIFGAFWEDPVVMAPGTLGGLSWAPMTFSPQTGLLYIPGDIINSAFSLKRQEWDAATGRLHTVGNGIGFMRPGDEPRAGTLTAIDPATGKIAWQKRTKFPIGLGSGLLTTASGLLLHGEPDGRFVAYDIRNGDELWSFQTGAGADAPAVTYEAGGEQYIAILAGGNSLNLSPRGDSLWAFKLSGKLPPAAAPPQPPLRQPAPPPRP